MITFAVEPLEVAWGEMIQLAEQHWKETQQYRHNQIFAPSFDRYNQYAKLGCFLQFTVRDEGKMVGYGGVYIVASMHTQAMIAQEDTWYLSPEYRRGWTALKFFRFMEEECRKRGAVQANLTVPSHLRLGILCERMGYKAVATHYAKDIHSTESESSSVAMQG